MNPKLTALAAEHGGVFSHHEALGAGYTASQVRHRIRGGVWTPIRRGLYAEVGDLSALPRWERERTLHRLALHAASRAFGGGVVLSHHVGRGLTETDVVGVDGVTVTSVRRAVVETACTSRFESAVAFMDAALNRRLTTADDLGVMLGQVRHWPGSGTARAAVGFADERAESVGESRLRVLIDNAGLPTPDLQTTFVAKSGKVAARVDFYFRDQAVIVEFDGRVKYRDNASEGVLLEKATHPEGI